MDLRDFAAFHLPAFAGDDVGYTLQIAITAAAAAGSAPNVVHWTLDAAGECATKSEGYSILRRRLRRIQCQALPQRVAGLSYPRVVAADERAHWSAERSTALGA